eukprot:190619_1
MPCYLKGNKYYNCNRLLLLQNTFRDRQKAIKISYPILCPGPNRIKKAYSDNRDKEHITSANTIHYFLACVKPFPIFHIILLVNYHSGSFAE